MIFPLRTTRPQVMIPDQTQTLMRTRIIFTEMPGGSAQWDETWPSEPGVLPEAQTTWSQAERPWPWHPTHRVIQRNDDGSDASYSSHDARHRARANSSQAASGKAKRTAEPKSSSTAPDAAFTSEKNMLVGIFDSDYECADSGPDEPHPNWIVAHYRTEQN